MSKKKVDYFDTMHDAIKDCVVAELKEFGDELGTTEKIDVAEFCHATLWATCSVIDGLITCAGAKGTEVVKEMLTSMLNTLNNNNENGE